MEQVLEFSKPRIVMKRQLRMLIEAIGRIFEPVRSSRLYHKVFVARIDHQQVEERKTEMMLKYHSRGLF